MADSNEAQLRIVLVQGCGLLGECGCFWTVCLGWERCGWAEWVVGELAFIHSRQVRTTEPTGEHDSKSAVGNAMMQMAAVTERQIQRTKSQANDKVPE